MVLHRVIGRGYHNGDPLTLACEGQYARLYLRRLSATLLLNQGTPI